MNISHDDNETDNEKGNNDKIVTYDNTLPFAERFRPKVLDDVLSHESVISTLKIYLKRR